MQAPSRSISRPLEQQSVQGLRLVVTTVHNTTQINNWLIPTDGTYMAWCAFTCVRQLRPQ